MPQIFKLGSYNVYFLVERELSLRTCACTCFTRFSSREHNKNLDYEIWKMLVV